MNEVLSEGNVIKRVDSFPLISDQALSQCVFLCDSAGRLDISYESHRDFLSAPRAFVISEFLLAAEESIMTGGQGLSDEQWLELQAKPFGVYVVEASELSSKIENGYQHYLFYSPKLILECIASLKPGSVNQKYHVDSARSALLLSLSSEL